MQLNHYKIGEVDILLYTLKDDVEMLKEDERFQLKLVGPVENINVEPYNGYPVFDYSEFILSTSVLHHRRTRDAILSENRVESFKALSANYMLTRYKASPLSKRVRDMAVEKYIELLPLTSSEADSDTKAGSFAVGGEVTAESTTLTEE